ncbi:MAG TPA: hypothetical protein VFZ25_04365, partial [Chloroflexota bacterium]|nr:hypothetical protein [Chloroflexota bacterium]
ALAIALLVAAGSLVGFPLTAGFAAHVALSRLADTVTLLYPAFAALVTILGTLAIVRSLGPVFQGSDTPRVPAGVADYLAGCAAVLILLAGVAPTLVLSVIR